MRKVVFGKVIENAPRNLRKPRQAALDSKKECPFPLGQNEDSTNSQIEIIFDQSVTNIDQFSMTGDQAEKSQDQNGISQTQIKATHGQMVQNRMDEELENQKSQKTKEKRMEDDPKRNLRVGRAVRLLNSKLVDSLASRSVKHMDKFFHLDRAFSDLRRVLLKVERKEKAKVIHSIDQFGLARLILMKKLENCFSHFRSILIRKKQRAFLTWRNKNTEKRLRFIQITKEEVLLVQNDEETKEEMKKKNIQIEKEESPQESNEERKEAEKVTQVPFLGKYQESFQNHAQKTQKAILFSSKIAKFLKRKQKMLKKLAFSAIVAQVDSVQRKSQGNFTSVEFFSYLLVEEVQFLGLSRSGVELERERERKWRCEREKNVKLEREMKDEKDDEWADCRLDTDYEDFTETDLEFLGVSLVNPWSAEDFIDLVQKGKSDFTE